MQHLAAGVPDRAPLDSALCLEQIVALGLVVLGMSDGYTMDHTASTFLLDAEGRFAGTLEFKESERVAVQKLRLLLGRSRF